MRPFVVRYAFPVRGEPLAYSHRLPSRHTGAPQAQELSQLMNAGTDLVTPG